MVDKGIVAFYDILGYQNIIDNNEIEKVSSLVSNELKILPDKVRDKMRLYAQEGVSRNIIDQMYLSRLNVKLISDSMLISASTNELDPSHEFMLWYFFLLYSGLLCKEMFQLGLPIRGAIEYGEYYLDEQCFAGKPIINCYRLSQRLDFSGVVLTPLAREQFMKQSKDKIDPRYEFCGIDYLVPMRDGNEEKLFLLNWFYDNPNANIRQDVFESFRGHSKDIPQDAKRKMENTEYTIRALLVKVSEVSKAEKALDDNYEE